ncbi:hypothetical protein ACS0TY_033689 [Phlomoides rotata]
MEYKHFSHDHTLTLYKVPEGQNFQCHGCNLPCNDSIFACWTCRFFLHDHCANANRFVKHPSHSSHPLTLMPAPTYCTGSFLCNACGAPGSSFSYSCALCEVDLHLNCAYLPQEVSHNAHQHALCLSFGSSGSPNCVDYCKVCRKEMGFKQWCYVCERSECGFRVHTFCGSSEVKSGLYQDDRLDSGGTPADQIVRVDQIHAQTELTPEEVILEIGRMNMELQLAQGLAQIIAYR